MFSLEGAYSVILLPQMLFVEQRTFHIGNVMHQLGTHGVVLTPIVEFS
jgi:hypothetical protein